MVAELISAATVDEFNKVSGRIGTVIALVIVIALIIYGNSVQNYLVVAICFGAIGGLVHEIAQSGGKFMFPAMDNDNFMLGGLMGLLDGAIAGLLVVQGQSTAPANPQFFYISVFLAGLALKGVNDAINPKNANIVKNPAG